MKEGWKYKPFGEVFPIKMGKTPPRGDKSCWDTKKESENKWVSISDISQNEGKVIFDTKEYITDAAAEKIFRVKANSLLMSFKLTIGKMAFAGTDLYTNEAIIAIPENKEYNLKFLYFYLSAYNWSSLTDGNEKVKGKTLNKESIGRIKLPIISLSDQQRIVSYLDAEFAKIEALKANAEKQLQAAKDLFQAALKELLTPKEGWVEKKLGEIGNICGRIGFRGYTTKDMVSGPNEGAITLSPSNIQDGAMDYTKCQYISWYKYNESPEIMVQNGDVLIVKTGSSYGKSAIVENLPHKATINPQSVVIKKIRINNRLFAYLIRTPWVQNDFDNFVAGTAIPTFSQANLSKVLLTFPQDLNEQQRIADRLDALSANVKALQTNYTETITLCNDLKQALLKKVFE